MWPRNWREQLPATLSGDWDMVIIGGGITGAGILLEAARRHSTALSSRLISRSMKKNL